MGRCRRCPFREEDAVQRITLLLLALMVTPVVATAAGASKPSDAQIADIVVTANQVDIDAGNLAKTRAQSAEVKALAQRMVDDHTSVNRSAADLVTKLKVKPQPNATSAGLKQDGDDNLARLRGLDGARFDAAYVDNEVKYHQAVIDALDQTLIPAASNAELKALLVKVRPSFVSHLEHAKHLQSQLHGAAGR
jgi:putative membrane protein